MLHMHYDYTTCVCLFVTELYCHDVNADVHIFSSVTIFPMMFMQLSRQKLHIASLIFENQLYAGIYFRNKRQE